MCAIISWSQYPNSRIVTPKLIRDLYRNASQWGPHSVGLSYNLGGQLNIFKRAVTPAYFVYNCAHRIERAAKADQGFGHVRWATHGEIIDKNAHPFVHYRKDGSPIVFCHNGVISNYLDFGNFVVDSECLGQLIERRCPSEARGSVGLVWFEDGKLYCYRKSQSLHSYTCIKNDEPFTLVVSRPQILSSIELDDAEIYENRLEEYECYQITPEGIMPIWKEENPLRDQYTYFRKGGQYSGG